MGTRKVGHLAAWKQTEMHRGFFYETLKESDHLEDTGLTGWRNIKIDLK
jgi:hypothetical protein